MRNTAEYRERVEAIFFEALSRSSAVERNAFLDGACQGDSVLRRDVEALLDAQSKPDSFLERPVGLEMTSPKAVAEGEGTVIGRYRLLQQLGKGGFGVVYMAEQTTPVRRKVAVKVIKPGMDSKEVIARFEAERQALALMDHPNIAKVLDAGTTDSGRPYFVMGLVKGVSLTEYCDTNNLPTTDRLRLFMDVCRAIQHAHQKGIIHRDLKPSNVMVTLHDGIPVAKVIDFGVSKALSQQLTEKTLFTRYGQIVGTPQYMSPEQAELSGLDIDTRSDIYSLGVLLYELLTGRLPFDAEALREAGFEGMRRMIREEEPPKPSTKLKTLEGEAATTVASHRSSEPALLQKAVMGDLDWIVMKSLEKDRNRRYETAVNLLRDIERHLSDEPVTAGPPTLRYQLTKVFRRHRVATLTAAAISAAVVLGLCMTTMAWMKATQERRRAELAFAEAKKQQHLAEESNEKATENEREAKRQANRALSEARKAEQTLAVLKDLLGEASPSMERGKNATVREFLDEFAARLDSNPIGNPEVEIDVRMTLASAFLSFFEEDLATKQFEQVYALAQQAYDDTSIDYARFVLEFAQTVTRRGGGENFLKLRRGREDYLREALRICDDSGAEPALRIEVLTRIGEEGHLRDASALASSMSSESQRTLTVNPFRALAQILMAQSHLSEAENLAEKAVSFAAENLDVDEAVKCELLLSNLYRYERSKLPKALSHANRAITMSKNGSSGQLYSSLLNRMQLEFFRYDLEHVAEESLAANALEVRNELHEAWPQFVRRDPGELAGWVAGALFCANRDKEAHQALALAQDLPGSTGAWPVGQWLRKFGDLRNADRYYSQIDIDRLDNPWIFAWRARARWGARDYGRAISLIREGIDWLDKAGATNEWTSSWMRLEYAFLLHEAGRVKDSQEIFADVTARLKDSSEKLWGDLTPACRTLAAMRSDSVQPEIAALEAQLLEVSADLPFLSAVRHAALAELSERKGESAAAIDHYIMSMRARTGAFEAIPLEWVNNRVVELLTKSNQVDRLERLLREDVARRDKWLSAIHPERAFVRIRLGEVLTSHNRDLEDALELLTEANKVYEVHGDWIPQTEHQQLKDLLAEVNRKLDGESDQ